MDHDDWTHWPPDDPGPHDGGHDDLAGHDPFGVDHPADPGDPFAAHDPFGAHDTDPFAAHDGDEPGGDGPDPFDAPDLRHDADLGDLDGHDLPGHPDDPQPSIVDGSEPAEGGVDTHLFGVDHDLPPGDGAGPDFPPPLDLADRPEPIDGYPWSDPDALGDPAGTGWPEPVDAPPPADDLLSYAGMDPPGAGIDAWAALLDSDDPAVSALARWWGPGG